MRSGFGGRHGSLSSRSTGQVRVEDKSSNFLNLVKHIAGDDLLFCLDSLSINDIAVGGTITNWFDAWDVFNTNFTSTDKPTLDLYNGKPVVSFNGSSNFMSTAANATQLNSKTALSLVYFSKNESSSDGFQTVLEYGTYWYSLNGFAVAFQLGASDFAVYNGQDQHPDGTAVGGIAGADGTNVTVNNPLALGVVFNRNAPGAGAGLATKPYVNGSPVATSNIYTGGSTFNIDSAWASNDKLYMGRRQGGTTLHMNGSIGCFIAVTRVLADGEMSRLQNAVLNRYNVGAGASPT
tara:strand:+ start:229 stop:1107 length:879 start_codon:yes stop_codon:yes gene_type:complete